AGSHPEALGLEDGRHGPATARFVPLEQRRDLLHVYYSFGPVPCTFACSTRTRSGPGRFRGAGNRSFEPGTVDPIRHVYIPLGVAVGYDERVCAPTAVAPSRGRLPDAPSGRHYFRR